ncbi:hypothetical protein K438DRAFT_1819068 [Mycena galopus ATCC 62051]|nr:hypothetical protein K438DRAFT_1819068 [Mycena galopus ATCC 62051]
MQPTLPTEVLEAVVDASRDDRTTVAACGAAARQFLVRSRMHLFADISLGSPRANVARTKSSLHILYPSSPTRCDILSELMEVNPNLARFITGLELSEGAHPTVTTYWISQSTTLVPIARRLSSLRIFTLREVQGSQWSPALIQAMHLCIHAPSIKAVQLMGLRVTDLPSFFAIFSTARPRTLQSLQLSNLVVHGDPPAAGKELCAQNDPSRIAVHTLDISCSSHEQHLLKLLSESPPLINLSHVRHLRLSVDDQPSEVTRWIQVVAASLVRLDLEFKQDWTTFGPSEEEISLERLSMLRFEISGSGAMSAALSRLQTFRALLLTDIIFFSLDAEFHTAAEDEFNWSTLDLLISRQSFPSLTTVRFELATNISANWQPLLRERLPNLNDSRMLILNPTS